MCSSCQLQDAAVYLRLLYCMVKCKLPPHSIVIISQAPSPLEWHFLVKLAKANFGLQLMQCVPTFLGVCSCMDGEGVLRTDLTVVLCLCVCIYRTTAVNYLCPDVRCVLLNMYDYSNLVAFQSHFQSHFSEGFTKCSIVHAVDLSFCVSPTRH